jgi:hypothetical protein
MAQFDPASDREGHDPNRDRRERAPQAHDPNQLGAPFDGPSEQALDSAAPVPVDWTAAAREVLQGLTEEVPENARGDVPDPPRELSSPHEAYAPTIIAPSPPPAPRPTITARLLYQTTNQEGNGSQCKPKGRLIETGAMPIRAPVSIRSSKQSPGGNHARCRLRHCPIQDITRASARTRRVRCGTTCRSATTRTMSCPAMRLIGSSTLLRSSHSKPIPVFHLWRKGQPTRIMGHRERAITLRRHYRPLS